MESLKEKIRHEAEWLRLVWATLIATVGGTASLLLGGTDHVRLGLAAVGVFLILWFSVITILLDLKIRSLLEQLDRQEKEQRK
jgi:hypothetical protein